MFSRFFIDRPVFAFVVSILIMLGGTVAIFVLPVDQYPQITPPTIQIDASYPGADAKTAAESVASPIEQQLSGIKNLLYFSSLCSNNGAVKVVCTFEIGTDQDLAAVEVQNRLAIAEPRLPTEVTRQGVTVTKSSTSMLTVLSLESDGRYDDIYLSNYATINMLDMLKRVPGVGDVAVFGTKDYSMRIWVNPDQLAARGLTVTEVAEAIREQNAVFPAGTIGQRPTKGEVELTVPVLTRGRLQEVADYENIILVANSDGSILRLKDVARVELGAQSYDMFGRVNGKPTTLLPVYLQVGANALDTLDGVKAAMESAASSFPEGVSYSMPHDTTLFIRDSMAEVIHTLLEAVLLVLVVVFVFLQSWRATLIPLLAVPVAIIGTFGGMLALGFSINTLTMFGLVLAIGIVVDDAIIVVENVERIMEHDGLGPREATIKAMEQVTGPVIAIVLVLSAVFVPVAFLGGLTGQLYRQFAVTIAVSVAISGLVALTLSPALCRLILKPGHGQKAKVFQWFDACFDKMTLGYTEGVRKAIRRVPVSLGIFGLLCLITFGMQRLVPSGFLPDEDQGYILVSVMLPDGSSLDRTDATLREVEKHLMSDPAVQNVVLLGGLDFLSGGITSTSGSTMFIKLKPFEERQREGMSSQEVALRTMIRFGDDPTARVLAFNPPAIQGLGTQAGFQLELQSRGGGSVEDLVATAQQFINDANANPQLAGVRGTLRVTQPQLYVELNRDKTKMMGVPVGNVFEAMQAYLSTLYVNDFNKYGRIWRVQLQAESEFRDSPSDIGRIFVRNAEGNMVPLSGVTDVSFRAGPNAVSHFNGFPSVQITGAPAAGISSGQAMDDIVKLGQETLPVGYGFEWSGASYQEIKTGSQAPKVLAFGILVVFLVLAAQYEMWSLPIAVLGVLPIAVMGALMAVWSRGLVQDIYFQIGLLTLVGLSAKNAILIVEFCVASYRSGMGLVESALEAARLRFRPIVMTSLAFILGVVPLAISSGAGSAARHSIGTGVIGGMAAATSIAIFFVPLFFVLIQRGSEYVRKKTPMVLPPEDDDDDATIDHATDNAPTTGEAER
ncbi:MAG: multidrug efflux RND transporter permease subunit [Pseudodesulfovibrio sp.]|uniref:Transporter, hydrophobe/amphiphile efflux-1 (HAE1) family n=2 Tax=Pseudodesulfovibrio aespoeensis TaxID=182210 RepID=E6VRD9_PSEA9|nr:MULTISPECIES: multidrug efflux RND transporter permease subunit [Pseudodesulfovibrio]MBU4378685.1 multidrug efflux RND transporter permease subunit [Pseudomonadota bacterium]ADU61868.1 transporter, hydrophobe/amphiphile efflux-1 (HAE1) family [Pseudodesulfovibrio aespoeensis Aspo-2]MBU4514882.1 multidrug efflux RND transporter permease subunit [Pseudomonadota bacterium]MBU4522081.1 multidrug efflux RND transporter permease subunit [Pseudomonadota bacterium]MBU4557780.1 multidrug efflux RND 